MGSMKYFLSDQAQFITLTGNQHKSTSTYKLYAATNTTRPQYFTVVLLAASSVVTDTIS